MKANLLRLLMATTLLLALTPVLSMATPPQPAKPGEPQPPPQIQPSLLVKIEPLVLKELKARGATTYLVYLYERADLALAQTQPDKLSRRAALVSLLQDTAQRSQAPIIAYLRGQQAAGKVTALTSYWIFNGLAVTGDMETMLALAARPDVERIQADHIHWLDAGGQDTKTKGHGDTEIADEADDASASPGLSILASQESPQAIEWNIAKIRAPQVWSTLSLTGQGVVVANMDTGVYFQHPALLQKYRGYSNSGVNHNYNWFDATGTYPTMPNDGHGHGTHTMGTIVGADPSGANQIGVAPGARWIAVKIFTDGGWTYDSYIHAAFQWLMAPTNLQRQSPDPTKAPDIVSNSWGSTSSSDQTFWQDVNAWRAAGILPVFAAGNAGPYARSVDSPGSFPQSLAVGATNSSDVIANFSGRGPSPWGETKPEVVAPGVNVRSSVPPVVNASLYQGGWDGTSMATPHGAGVAALLWQARPDLTITATEYFLTSTALPLPNRTQSPNNDYGWGRLDAYQAASAMVLGGRFWGQVTDRGSGAPLAGATITLLRQDGEGASHTTTDAQGYYTFTVGAGAYNVTASSYWYSPQTAYNVEIRAGFTTIRDFHLTRLEAGIIRGQVASGGAPMTATIAIAGVPLAISADASGFYSATVPVGVYSIRAKPASGFRQGLAAGVVVQAHTETIQNFELVAGPRILLVDADAWSLASRLGFYETDLDATLFTYDLWRVMTTVGGLPPTATLQLYDVVIWHQPATSPGYVGAWSRLGSYLDGGGRLFISGQDIGYWDDYWYYHSAYRTYLQAMYMGETSYYAVRAASADIFTGITLTLNTPDSAVNQSDPDAIRAISSTAAPVLTYTLGMTVNVTAGLKIQTPAYRAIYLPFGLEGAGPSAARQAVLGRSLAWLTMPSLHKTVDPVAVTPGDVVTFTLALVNDTAKPAPLVSINDPLPARLSYISGSATGGLVYNASQERLEWQGRVAPATTLTYTFQARVAADTPVPSSLLNVAYVGEATTFVPAGASVWVDLPDLSRSSKVAGNGMGPTGQEITYTIYLSNTGRARASATVIDPLPAGLTFAGSASPGVVYDPTLNQVAWSGTVGPAGPPSASYTYATSDMPGGPGYAWVDVVISGTHVMAGDDSLHGPFDIGFAFPYYGIDRSQFYVSSNGFLAFTQPSGSWYANYCLPYQGAPALALAPWWDDLYGYSAQGIYYWSNRQDMLVVSYIGFNHYSYSGSYTFQVILRADGTITYQYEDMRGYLTGATIGLQDDGGATGISIACNHSYVHDGLAIRLTPPGVTAAGTAFSFRAHVGDGFPLYGTVTNTAVVSAGSSSHVVTATSVVNTIDISTSSKSVDKSIAGPGDNLVYTVSVRNSGTVTTIVSLSDTLPAHVAYVPGAGSSGIGYDEATRTVFWRDSVGPGMTAPVTFTAAIVPGVPDGTTITNAAVVVDELGRSYTRQISSRYLTHNLTTSRVDAWPVNTSIGNVVTFTVTIVNSGLGPTNFMVTDTLPLSMVFLPASLDVSHGTAYYDAASRSILWNERIPGQHLAYMRFAVRIEGSGNLTNVALIQDSRGQIIERSASLRFLEYRFFFGSVMVEYGPPDSPTQP